MLQSPEPKYSPNPSPANSYNPVKPAGFPADQANIGRSLVIKGEVTGAESLFIDGRVEGSINVPGNRVTIGRNGNVAANITAQEVVIMGKVHGNVDCEDRLDIRGEGLLSGDVITHRISVEEQCCRLLRSRYSCSAIGMQKNQRSQIHVAGGIRKNRPIERAFRRIGDSLSP